MVRWALRCMCTAAIFTTCAGTVVPGVALAQPAPESQGVGAVAVSVLGTPEEGAAIGESLREVVSRLGLRMTADPRELPLARVAVEVTPSSVTVVVRDSSGAETARRVLPRAASLEILREEVALVVAQALDLAKVSAQRKPPAPKPPIEPPPVPPTKPPEPLADRRSTVEVGPLLSARARNPGNLAALGAGLTARAQGAGKGPLPIGVFSAELGQPMEPNRGGVDLHIAPLSARLGPGLSLQVGRTLELDGTLSLGVDVLRVTPASRQADLAVGDRTVRASPVLAPAIAGRLSLGAARVALSLGVDLDFGRVRYVVLTPTGQDVAFAQWPIRPVLGLSVVLPVIGGDGAR